MTVHDFKYTVKPEAVFYKFIQTRTSNYGLDIMDAAKQIILSAAVKLGQNIVQKQHGRIMNAFFYKFNLR